MKRNQPRARSASARKVRRAPVQSVEEYLARLPQPQRSVLKKMRAAIHSVLPRDAEEVISYGIPAFRRGEVLVWYAAFRDHCSLFPKASVIADFQDQLKGYIVSKGTIQFPLDEPLPLSLIKRIVRARAAQPR